MFRKEPKQLIAAALAPLQANPHDYASFIRRLDTLGAYLRARHATSKDKDPITWLENYCRDHMLKQSMTLTHPATYCAFEIAWRDASLKGNADKHVLHAKQNIHPNTRKNINMGLHALALAIHVNKAPAPLAADAAKKLDADAMQAIHTFKTTRQRVLEITGTLLAFIMALASGVTFTATVALAITGWPLSLMIITGCLTFAITSYLNWLSFSTIVPTMLHDIFGKDSLFEGWLNYRDAKTGNIKPLSLFRKLLLPFLVLLTIVASATAGVVTFNLLTQVGNIHWLSIILTTLFSLGNMILILKPIVDLIKTDNISHALISNIKHIFDPANEKNHGKSRLQLNIEKGIAYGILGIVSVGYLFATIYLQLRNSAAVGGLIKGVHLVSAAIASAVVYGISAAAILARLPSVYDTCKNSIAYVFSVYHNIFSKPVQQTDKPVNPLVVLKKTFTVDDPNEARKKAATAARIGELNQLTTPAKPSIKTAYYRLFLPQQPSPTPEKINTPTNTMR